MPTARRPRALRRAARSTPAPDRQHCGQPGNPGSASAPIVPGFAGGGATPERFRDVLARPHLADPYWTLREATRIGDRAAPDWPLPYLAGRDQAWRLAEREAEAIRA